MNLRVILIITFIFALVTHLPLKSQTPSEYETTFPEDWDPDQKLRKDAGRVLAWGMSENGGKRVIIVEFGKSEDGKPTYKVSEKYYSEREGDWFIPTVYLHPAPGRKVSNPANYRRENTRTFEVIPTPIQVASVRSRKAAFGGMGEFGIKGIEGDFWKEWYGNPPRQEDYELLNSDNPLYFDR